MPGRCFLGNLAPRAVLRGIGGLGCWESTAMPISSRAVGSAWRHVHDTSGIPVIDVAKSAPHGHAGHTGAAGNLGAFGVCHRR
jgi:hypothetical protein